MHIYYLALPVTALAFSGSPSFSLHSNALSLTQADSRAESVKAAFSHAWDGYMKYAFPHDELHPVSNGYGDSRNHWGASAVDALSTAIIMKNATIVDQVLDHIATIDYSNTTTEVSLFETTIRYLGGMLSGYDLLKGPGRGLVDDAKVDVLLTQSKILADELKHAFDTPSGVPNNIINFSTGGTDGATTNGLAVTGTLVLEWTRLSDLLNDPQYAELAQRAEEHLLHPEPALGEPFPGLLGNLINIESGTFNDSYVTWNGGSDSYYEYLIKMYVYDPRRFGTYKDRWVVAANSTMAHLLSHPESRPNLNFLANYDGASRQYSYISQHLTCFDGGSFLLGGTVLDSPDFIDFGLALVDSCHATYNSTSTGIGPETFGWVADSVPKNQAPFYDTAGFYITDGQYILRPEVIESFYYAWRITNQEIYREWIWEAFTNINTYCRTPSGFSGLTDVNAPYGGQRIDNQESFLFAEVMKYVYMTFAPDDEWQVQKGQGNRWVFNTEAHPFQVYA